MGEASKEFVHSSHRILRITALLHFNERKQQGCPRALHVHQAVFLIHYSTGKVWFWIFMRGIFFWCTAGSGFGFKQAPSYGIIAPLVNGVSLYCKWKPNLMELRLDIPFWKNKNQRLVTPQPTAIRRLIAKMEIVPQRKIWPFSNLRLVLSVGSRFIRSCHLGTESFWSSNPG